MIISGGYVNGQPINRIYDKGDLVYSRVTYSPEAQQYFDRLDNQPSLEVKGWIADCINELVAEDLWDNIGDGLYVVGADEQQTYENWLTDNRLVPHGTVNFVPYRGNKGD